MTQCPMKCQYECEYDNSEVNQIPQSKADCLYKTDINAFKRAVERASGMYASRVGE